MIILELAGLKNGWGYQIITSSNSFLNSRDKGAHLMKFIGTNID
jgi:hypothetical protein